LIEHQISVQKRLNFLLWYCHSEDQEVVPRPRFFAHAIHFLARLCRLPKAFCFCRSQRFIAEKNREFPAFLSRLALTFFLHPA